MLLIKPVPLRAADEWKHGQILSQCDPNHQVRAALLRIQTISCRECTGFGHSSKKCPTARKFDTYRSANPLIGQMISRYRMRMNSGFGKNAPAGQWAFRYWSNRDLAESEVKPNKQDQEAYDAFVIHFNKLTCTSCSGWGHVATCWRKSKKIVKSKLGCPTQELIDQMYSHGIDKRKYAQLKPTLIPDKKKEDFPPLTISHTNGIASYATKSLKRRRTDVDHEIMMKLLEGDTDSVSEVEKVDDGMEYMMEDSVDSVYQPMVDAPLTQPEAQIQIDFNPQPTPETDNGNGYRKPLTGATKYENPYRIQVAPMISTIPLQLSTYTHMNTKVPDLKSKADVEAAFNWAVTFVGYSFQSESGIWWHVYKVKPTFNGKNVGMYFVANRTIDSMLDGQDYYEDVSKRNQVQNEITTLLKVKEAKLAIFVFTADVKALKEHSLTGLGSRSEYPLNSVSKKSSMSSVSISERIDGLTLEDNVLVSDLKQILQWTPDFAVHHMPDVRQALANINVLSVKEYPKTTVDLLKKARKHLIVLQG